MYEWGALFIEKLIYKTFLAKSTMIPFSAPQHLFWRDGNLFSQGYIFVDFGKNREHILKNFNFRKSENVSSVNIVFILYPLNYL